MFLTANALEMQYGIDGQIAKFFVDREPPEDNLYWKDKLLYLRPQPGYIFLPLIADLFYRSGVSKEDLLGKEFVQVLENIGHFAAEQELGFITTKQVVNKCIDLVQGKIKNEPFLFEIIDYFNDNTNRLVNLATPFKALHRGDFFLFSLCVLNIDSARLFELTKTWFALISILLLLDDAEDYLDDTQKGEENAFIESGSSKEGFQRIREVISKNLDHIAKINLSMADALQQKFMVVADRPGIKEYLNA